MSSARASMRSRWGPAVHRLDVRGCGGRGVHDRLRERRASLELQGKTAANASPAPIGLTASTLGAGIHPHATGTGTPRPRIPKRGSGTYRQECLK